MIGIKTGIPQNWGKILLFGAILASSLNAWSVPKILTLKSEKNAQHLHLDAFETENPDDISWVLAELKSHVKDMQDTHNTSAVLKINIDESLRKRFESNPELIAFLREIGQIAPVTIIYNKVPNHPIRRAYRKVLEKTLNSNYRFMFALVRGTAIGLTNIASLKISDGLPLQAAASIGVWMGLLTGNVQYWFEPLYNWMDNPGAPSKLAAKKFSEFLSSHGLIKTDKEKSIAKSIPEWIGRFGKWYVTEIIFVGLYYAGFKALGGVDYNIDQVFYTAFLATVAQGTWDFVIKTKEKIKHLRGEDKENIRYSSALSYLSVAIMTNGILMGLEALNIPKAELGFYTLGAAGAAVLTHQIIAKAKLQKEFDHNAQLPNAEQPPCEIHLSIPGAA